MRLLAFLPKYFGALFSNWLTYVGLVFRVVEVYRWLGRAAP